MPQTLTLAVCMSHGMTLSDFITPIEMLTSLNMGDDPQLGSLFQDVPYRFKMEYLAPAMGPVSGSSPAMVTVNPTMTYDAAIQSGKQFDVIWIPAAQVPDLVNGKDLTPPEEIAFLKHQAPGAKYVLSVCGGSLSLATAGVLEGKRATTNKMLFRAIEAMSSKKITWVPKARWVIDGNIWTSSGVTAGSDMALAFLEHLTDAKTARNVRGVFEVIQKGQEDDPFAEFHGLV